MKNFKKFAAMTAALTLAACSVAPMVAMNASAAETAITSGSITITTEEKDHSYAAYQIFNADMSKADDDTITFANVKWGNGVDSTKVADICSALKDLGITKDDKNVFAKGTNNNEVLATAAEVAEALAKVASNSDITKYEDIDKIAKIFADNKAAAATVTFGAYSATDGGYKAEISEPGYYLVVETTTDNLAAGEAKTKYMLQVAGDEEVAPKADAPSVIKKVYEDSKSADAETVDFAGNSNFAIGNGYNDVADYSLSEEINFEIFGTLPSTFANYKGYYYKFTDTMDPGLSLYSTSTVDDTETEKINANDFKVTVTDSDKVVKLPSNAYTYTYDSANNKFTIAIADLKEIDMDADADGVQVMSKDAIIKVEYSAYLNSNAQIGKTGNKNKVDLTYSNNSNTASGGDTDETGTTPEDYNIVFTYQIDVTKYLGKIADNNKANATKGTQAGFKLKNSDDKWAKFDKNNKFTEWVKEEKDATQVETTANGKFSFIGLQDGTYTLVETLVPTGYNKMADKEFTIAADTSNGTKGTCQDYSVADTASKLTSLTLDEVETVAENKAAVAFDVENLKGSGLPSTGGIGTTLFYVGGGCMAGLAGLFLITKKRMGKKEN